MNVRWPFADPASFVVAGDWHGNTTAVRRACDAAGRAGITVVVQLGDFGLWPGPRGERYLESVNSAAASCGVTVAWVDGNHEDFSQLSALPISDDGLRWMGSNLCHIPRASRWSWHGVRFAALGGATSLDRASRTLGKSWWLEEQVTDEDLSRLADGGPCDVLLTHDCPSGVPIPKISHRDYSSALASGWPLSELERAWHHRDRMREAVQATTPAHLWHGHYHVRYSALVESFSPALHVEGLSWDGDSRTNNLMVARLADGEVRTEGIDKVLNRD